MILFLIGMPGSGKSTLGKKLSIEYKIPYFDLDQLIENETGQTIPLIIESKGEDFFRKLEKETLETFQNDPAILSCGGGAPCFYNNIGWMNTVGKTLFIEVELETLVHRIMRDGIERRPLLHHHEGNLLSHLNALYKKRLPFYRQAQFNINGTSEVLPEDLNFLLKS